MGVADMKQDPQDRKAKNVIRVTKPSKCSWLARHCRHKRKSSGFICRKGKNPTRGFQRGHSKCTYDAAIRITDLANFSKR